MQCSSLTSTVITFSNSRARFVEVESVAVHHEPVPDAVAYRVTTPDGSVVISGDTRVCQEVLTHLGPPPQNEVDEQGFSDDVRAGGYTGHVFVGRDLMSVTF
jgi:mRNA degradation ribonuclease J1/J2